MKTAKMSHQETQERAHQWLDALWQNSGSPESISGKLGQVTPLTQGRIERMLRYHQQ